MFNEKVLAGFYICRHLERGLFANKSCSCWPRSILSSLDFMLDVSVMRYMPEISDLDFSLCDLVLHWGFVMFFAPDQTLSRLMNTNVRECVSLKLFVQLKN